MKKHGKVYIIVALVLLIGAAVLFGNLYEAASEGTPEEPVRLPSITPAASGEEQTRIQLSANGVEVDGPGASVSGSTLAISQAGAYFVNGVLAGGQIRVDAGDDDTVILVLNGVELSNATQAAIYVENAGLTQVVLAEGSVNSVESGAPTERLVADESASGGAIYARDDLAISGTGSLRVFGYINNGVQTANDLSIDGGNIEITALNHGLKGKDSVTITDGEFFIRSGGDGIQSDDTTGEGYGVISISGGTFSIESSGDGIQAETALAISGGDFTLFSGGGSENAAYSSPGGWDDSDSNWDMEDEAAASAKGLKSGVRMTLTDGMFSIDAYDDAIHSNGRVSITGGVFTLASGDDGVHADTELTVEGGELQVTRCYEGLEGNQIAISGGTVRVHSSDDGVNAYGGQNSWDWGGASNTTQEQPNLSITGGSVSVNAEGDGLDSNGNIYVEGGIVIVDGPSRSMNSAIDSGSENGGICVVNGGTVIAIGASGMAETFAESSAQCSFRHNFDSSFSAGSEITIADMRGNVLFRHTAAKSASSVVFSCPELSLGETYHLTAGSQTVDITLDSVSTSSGMSSRWGW